MTDVDKAWDLARTVAVIDKQLLSSNAVELITGMLAAEREACAKIAEEYAADDVAELIRARGGK